MKRLLLISTLAALFALAASRRKARLATPSGRNGGPPPPRRAGFGGSEETNNCWHKKLANCNATPRWWRNRQAATSSKNILSTTASKEELHHLRDALKESEHRREADKKLFLEKFEELRKLMASAPAAPAFSAPASPRAEKERAESTGGTRTKSPPPGVPDSGVFHLVEKNQTALEILKAYNDDQKARGRPGKITLRQLEAANPGADMNKLRAGQKLFIPIRKSEPRMKFIRRAHLSSAASSRRC